MLIQQNDSSITHSGSGLLLSGSNYVFTSPIRFGLSVAPNKEKMFSVFPTTCRKLDY